MRGARRGRRALAAGALAATLAAAAPPPDDGLRWWTRDALEKVRPDDRPGPATGVELSAARNEFEPFQLVLRAGSGPVEGIDVEVRDFLAASGDARLPAELAAVYLEGFVELDRPSWRAGGTGAWPDPLIPRRDAYAGERRAAFPFDLPAGRSQPLWLEVYVPVDAPAGLYRTEVVVSVGGRPRLVVPWSLRVRDFALPSTSSLRTSFGFSGVAALAAHRGGYTDDAELGRLTRRYAEAALRHRISLHGGTQIPPPARFSGGRAQVDWQAYDREVAPLLDGTLFAPGEPLAGARATSVEVRTPGGLDDEQKALYWRAWVGHFRERGWLDRLFLYLWDEPTAEQYAEVARVGRVARRADPALTTLLTEQPVAALADVVDLWVPLVNCVEGRGAESPCPPAEALPRARRERWWYQSCASHGCGVVGGAELAKWPTYVIDAPALGHRILPWRAWAGGIAGELYYNTVEAYAGDEPWLDPHRHGGNGDGTLFYPGTPARIGGSTDVPVESLRLKLIREGLEDYEYLVALDAVAGAGREREAARELARSRPGSTPPRALRETRERIARAIETRSAGR